MEVWVILLLLWVAWKVFGSIFEEMQARKRKQQTNVEETISQPPPRRVPPVTRPAERKMAKKPSAYSPTSMDEEERDIERLLREAMAKKHHPTESPENARPRTRKVTYAEQRTVEYIPPSFPRHRQETLPPMEEYHFEPPQPIERYHRKSQPPPAEPRKVVRKRVIRRVEPLPSRGATRLPEPAAKLTVESRIRRRHRRGRSPLFLADGLNKCEVRKGIVMAEILGEPKAFRM
jgi:hypothetical protein